MMKSVIFLVFFLYNVSAADLKARAYIMKASAYWPSGDQTSIGAVDFTQNGNNVYVNGTIYELSPGKHGFHVHQLADLSNNCLSTGGHFNPYNKSHGAPSDTERHVGDLGNIESTGSVTVFEMNDSVISLSGANSIIGRSIVIHVGEDDLGRGNQPDSKTTGHAGARFACGVIGLLDEPTSSSSSVSLVLALISPIALYFMY